MWCWTQWSCEGELPPRQRSCAAALVREGGEDTLVTCGGVCADTVGNGVYAGALRAGERKLHWRTLPSAGTRRHDHAAAVLEGRLLLFAGCSRSARRQQFHSDVWELNVSGGPQQCRRLRVGGCPLLPRSNHTAVPWRGQVWLFGGCDLGKFPPKMYNDMLSFDGDVWTRQQAAERMAPCPRSGHSCVAWRGGLVLFGGWDGDTLLDDVAIWDGARWFEPSPGPAGARPAGCAGPRPTPRACHTATLVGADSMVVYGGLRRFDQEASSQCVREGHLHVLDVPRGLWSCLPVAGEAPPHRAFHCAVPLASHDGLLVYGGGTRVDQRGEDFNDAHELRRLAWSPRTHRLFPREVQEQARFWLLLGRRMDAVPHLVWLRVAGFFLEAPSAWPSQQEAAVASPSSPELDSEAFADGTLSSSSSDSGR